MKIVSYAAAVIASACIGQSAVARVINFDDQMPATISFSGSNPIVTGPSQGSKYTVPDGSTGFFFADYDNDNIFGTSVATIGLGGTYNSFSVLWGTVDSYNTLQFLSNNGVVLTVTGSQAAAQSGATVDANQTITYSTSGFSFDSVRLTTVSNAFEIDNISVNAVPEPGTWGMLGLGTVGAGAVALRRRRAA